MTTATITEAQTALKNYYKAILALEKTGVICVKAGDVLSATMMEWVGDWEDYDGEMYCG